MIPTRASAATFPTGMIARRRVFGDDLASPRRAYFALIPGTLAFAGMLSWALANNVGFLLGCAVASAVGFYTLWQWLFRKAPTRFSTLIAMALLLGYGGGALNTWVMLPRGGLTVAAAMGLGPGIPARGIGAVLWAAALLYFWGEIFEKPIFGREFRFTVSPRMRSLIYVGTLAMIAGYATHAIGFQGASAVEGHLNPAGAFLSWLYIPLTAISVTAFLTAPRGSSKVLCGLASMALLLMLSAMGRRTALYMGIEVLLVMELAGYKWRGRGRQKFLMILGVGFIIVVTSLTFMLLRLAGWNARNPEQVTVGRRIEIAGKMIQKGEGYQLASSATKVNLESRTFVLGFFSNVLDASSRKTPTLGENLDTQLKSAIPTILYPNKDRFFSEENLVDQQFGFAYGDEANSILTGGATDFGLAGALIYPLLLVFLMRLIYEIAAKWFGAVPLMFIALSLIFTCLQTEIVMSGYFSAIRATLFFGLLPAAFAALPSFRLRRAWYLQAGER